MRTVPLIRLTRAGALAACLQCLQEALDAEREMRRAPGGASRQRMQYENWRDKDWKR